MRRTIQVWAAAAAASLAIGPAAAAETARSAEVRVRFDGVKPGGRVLAALYDTEAGWKGRAGTRNASAAAGGGPVEVVFAGLPPGRYAVMAYHDANANGRLDTLPIGLPTEAYGFSNDARGMFGPPAWSKAVFEAGPGETVQSVRLR